MVDISLSSVALDRKVMSVPVVGRRKAAVVRVHFKSGTGKLFVNDRDFHEYFKSERHKVHTRLPLDIALESDERFREVDIYCSATGGGATGQSEAMRLAIARKLVELSSGLRLKMRTTGLLTCDSRKVESKKYGMRKARKRCQYAKR